VPRIPGPHIIHTLLQCPMGSDGAKRRQHSLVPHSMYWHQFWAGHLYIHWHDVNLTHGFDMDTHGGHASTYGKTECRYETAYKPHAFNFLALAFTTHINMSITRTLFNEVRPFFRLFDEVARGHPGYLAVNRPFGRQFEPFLQPLHPTIDLSEQGNEYIVEAEVPGVKKENLDVRVGDGGRCVTVEGQLYARSPSESESTDKMESACSNEVNESANESAAQGETKGKCCQW
jgi:HSP20 family molecular chaperone IbpA